MFYDCKKSVRKKVDDIVCPKMSSNGGGGDQPSEGCGLGDTLVLGEMPGEVAGSNFTGTSTSTSKWNGLELARAAEADDRYEQKRVF